MIFTGPINMLMNAIEIAEEADRVYGKYGWIATSTGIVPKKGFTLEFVNGKTLDVTDKNSETKKNEHSASYKEEYDRLECKYWDAQRLIDKYASDYDKLHSHFQKIKDSEMKHRELYRRQVVENIKLHNELVIEKIRNREQKKYLDAYTKLYADECVKNNRLKKICGRKD